MKLLPTCYLQCYLPEIIVEDYIYIYILETSNKGKLPLNRYKNVAATARTFTSCYLYVIKNTINLGFYKLYKRRTLLKMYIDQSSSNPTSSNVNTCIHIRAVSRECRGRLFVVICMNVYLHPLSN